MTSRTQGWSCRAGDRAVDDRYRGLQRRIEVQRTAAVLTTLQRTRARNPGAGSAGYSPTRANLSVAAQRRTPADTGGRAARAARGELRGAALRQARTGRGRGRAADNPGFKLPNQMDGQPMPTLNAEQFEQAWRECVPAPIRQIGTVQPHAGPPPMQPEGGRLLLQASGKTAEFVGCPPRSGARAASGRRTRYPGGARRDGRR